MEGSAHRMGGGLVGARWGAVQFNSIQFDLLPLNEGRTRTGMHVWHGRGAGLTSMAWDA